MESSGTVPPKEHSSLPMVAGILLVLAGVLGLAMWGYYIAIGSIVSTVPGMPMDMSSWFTGMMIVCGAIGIIFSIIALLGGVMAIQRKKWSIALVGSILGLFTLGFLLGSVLSLVALILIAISKKDFV